MPNLNGFDAANVEPVPNFDPIPAGEYLAMIVGSEEKTSRNGHQFLSLEFEVLDGQYKGRKIWANLNLSHPNPETVKFARAELAAICKAVGVLRPTDSVQLHNLPMQIGVRCVSRKDTGELQNRIKGYSPKAATQAAVQQTQSPAAPWRR